MFEIWCLEFILFAFFGQSLKCSDTNLYVNNQVIQEQKIVINI